MKTTFRAKIEITRTDAEMELKEYTNPEYTPHVRDFLRRRSTRCRRCSGLMMREGSSLVAYRCVQCGDIVDPAILKNRTVIMPIRRTRYVRAGKKSQYPIAVLAAQ